MQSEREYLLSKRLCREIYSVQMRYTVCERERERERENLQKERERFK